MPGFWLTGSFLPTLPRLEELKVTPIDLVVCNLYPFADTVASGAGFADCIEKIDIGGPSMIRAAAKNHADVAVIVDPSSYDDLAAALQRGGIHCCGAPRTRSYGFQPHRHL